MSSKPITAIAVFDTKKIKGIVRFQEDFKNDCVVMDIHIHGLKKMDCMDFTFMNVEI